MADPLRQAQEAANVFADTADKMGEVIVRLEAENARLRGALAEVLEGVEPSADGNDEVVIYCETKTVDEAFSALHVKR